MVFPVDYNEWEKEWFEWIRRQDISSVPNHFPKKNLLADDVLGTFRVMGREVELSEVTMPDFGARPERKLRYIGITWLVGDKLVNGGLVDSFKELADMLARGPQQKESV